MLVKIPSPEGDNFSVSSLDGDREGIMLDVFSYDELAAILALPLSRLSRARITEQ
jgi:hypothetical protein